MENIEKVYTIDRFEGRYALCENEDKQIENIEIEKLPKDVKEKDVVILKKSGKFIIDNNYTKIRKKYIDDLFNSI